MIDDVKQLISTFDNVEALQLIEIVFFRRIDDSDKNAVAHGYADSQNLIFLPAVQVSKVAGTVVFNDDHSKYLLILTSYT